MDQQLRPLKALPEDLSSTLSIRIRQLATVCNFSSRGSETFFWLHLLLASDANTHIYTHTHTNTYSVQIYWNKNLLDSSLSSKISSFFSWLISHYFGQRKAGLKMSAFCAEKALINSPSKFSNFYANSKDKWVFGIGGWVGKDPSPVTLTRW